MLDSPLERSGFVDALECVVDDLRLSQKDLLERGFERSVAPNTLSQALSRTKRSSTQPSVAFAREMVRAVANVAGLEPLLEFLVADNRLSAEKRQYYQHFYECVIASYSDSVGDGGIPRHFYDKYIFRVLSSCKNTAIFVGSIPERYLGKGFFEAIAQSIFKQRSNRNFKIILYIDSPQHLFWRSLALDPERDPQVRPFKSMRQKYDTMRSVMRGEVFRQLERLAKDHEQAAEPDLIERLLIFELDIPVYTDLIFLDDEILFSPRTSFRQSESSMFRVKRPSQGSNSFKNSATWNQLIAQVKLYRSLSESAVLCGPLMDEREKISVYSDDGSYVRGSVRRSSRTAKPELETSVVHGLIFDRRGRLCLQYRTGAETVENTNMWDKSFGAIRRPGQKSIDDTLFESLHREIFQNVARRLSDVHGDIYEPGKVRLGGDWVAGLDLGAACLPDQWNIYQYYDGSQLQQRRQWRFPKSSTIETSQSAGSEDLFFPNTFASVYILICDVPFQEIVDSACEKQPDVKICKWLDLKDLATQPLPQTRDLATYLNTSDEFSYGFYQKLRRISQKISFQLGRTQ